MCPASGGASVAFFYCMVCAAQTLGASLDKVTYAISLSVTGHTADLALSDRDVSIFFLPIGW